MSGVTTRSRSKAPSAASSGAESAGRLCLQSSSGSSGARTRSEVGSGAPKTLRTLRPNTGLSGTESSSPAAEFHFNESVEQTIR